MKPAPMSVLLIEDNPGDARLVREALNDARAFRFEVTHAGTLAAGIAEIERAATDIVLLDLSLPDGEGLASIVRLRRVAPSAPILVLTGREDEELALEAVRGGAQDYLVKGIDGGSLARGIAHAVERQRMLRELEATRREQLALKDRVLSHVSHELRAPLHAIGGVIALLTEGIAGEITRSQQEYLELAQQNVEQLARMIRDLLDATRAETGNLVIVPAVVDVAEIVADTIRSIRPVARAKQVTLEVDVPSSLAAFADAQRVRQVVTNLVDNALKFTPADGSVRVVAEADEDGTTVKVSVVDSGCGIAPEAIDRIFERLHQESAGRMERGLGLGLFISRALVEGQGGRIWAESRPGGGSVFSFTLPSRPARPAPALQPESVPMRSAAPAPS